MSIEKILTDVVTALSAATEQLTIANKINSQVLARSGADMPPAVEAPAPNPAPKKAKAKVEQKTPTLTYDETAAALLTVHKEIGKQALADLLKKYGASKGPELKPEDYADIKAEAEALVSARAAGEEVEEDLI